MKDLKIIILHQDVGNNPSPDEKDTLVQTEFVRTALEKNGYFVKTAAVDLDFSRLGRRLLDEKPDAVFNLVESLDGKGILIHLLPSFLSSMNIAYTGCSADAIMTTSNKITAKSIMKKNNLATPDWQLLKKSGEITLEVPFIMKSIWEHASVSIDDSSVFFKQIHSADEIGKAVDGFFIEKFISGREFNISVLEINGKPQVLPIAEISFSSFPEDKLNIVNYAAKWDESSFEYQNTPRVFLDENKEPELSAGLKELVLRCWDVFSLSGYARIDLRVDNSGQIRILEINTNPCLSPDAGFMAAAAHAGFSDQKVINLIIDAVLEKKPCQT